MRCTDFGLSVWGLKSFQSIDNVQNRAMRYFLGVHRFAPTLALIGNTGWLPSVYRRWGSIIRFWNRLVHMDNTRLTKRVLFIHDYNMCDNNWSSGIKQIMIKLECVHKFNDKSDINMPQMKSLIKDYYVNIGHWTYKIHQSYVLLDCLKLYLHVKITLH